MDKPPAHRSAAGRAARLLSAVLLAPLIVLTLWIFAIAPDHPWHAGTTLALTGYGALLLCLFGGISAGDALRSAMTPWRPIIAGVLPVAVGLAAILTPAPYCFALLATGFAALGAWDSFARYRDDAPEWFGAGRSRDTIVVVAALILAFVATAGQPG